LHPCTEEPMISVDYCIFTQHTMHTQPMHFVKPKTAATILTVRGRAPRVTVYHALAPPVCVPHTSIQRASSLDIPIHQDPLYTTLLKQRIRTHRKHHSTQKTPTLFPLLCSPTARYAARLSSIRHQENLKIDLELVARSYNPVWRKGLSATCARACCVASVRIPTPC
jgi:hypothetical protein